MDDPRTAPFTLGPGPSHTRSAVLLLHGFTGSPWEVRPLAEMLAARGHHVLAPRLPGHGQRPEAMAFVTHRDWERAAREALDSLSGYRDVFVGGLSMGALLAMLLADRAPSRVRGIALLAPVVGFAALDARLFRATRFLSLEAVHARWLKKGKTDLEDPAERAASPILERFPIARLRDLWVLQDLAWDVARHLKVPTLVLAARHDHVVPFAKARRLAGRIPGARFVPLERGFHIIPRDLSRDLANRAVAEFFTVPHG
jgi:carboxylesterase